MSDDALIDTALIDRISRTLRRAADEIERLRAENANLQWQLDFLRNQINESSLRET